MASTRARAGLAAAALAAGLFGAGAGGALAAGPAWRIDKSVNATLTGGKLESVSCSAAAACTAVGSYRNTSGINVTLAERWNGTAWQHQRTPNPPIDTNPIVRPDLSGVSCPAGDFCEAVGTYFTGNGFPGIGVSMAQAWNGHRWTMQRFPLPAGSFGTELAQVSCASASFCEAVGSYDVTGATLPLAARWNGSSWRLQRTPLPPISLAAFTVAFTAVSCTSASFCEAWGGGNAANPGPTVAERWNGRSWWLQAVPASDPVPNAVSCASASFCEAVGTAPSGDVAEAWNGSTWARQNFPALAGAPTGVSCPSARFCEAVAENFNSPGPTLAARWNGTAWAAQSVPSPAAAAGTMLSGVSCTPAASCEAAGEYQASTTANHQKALAENWNGSAWHLQHAAQPHGATDNSLSSVSCTSASFCEAVGSHTDSAGNSANLAEVWNGTSWALQSIPRQKSQFGPPSDRLLAVSCVSATFCEAVGSGAAGGEALQWNGTSWAMQQLPGMGSVAPMSLSCAAVAFCMAVGGAGRVDLWNGSSWSIGPNVTPFAQQGSAAEGVSCVSASFCEAVGGGQSGENAAVWNGSAWSAQPTGGPVSAVLNAVSCTATSACEAVGAVFGQPDQSLAEIWDGSAWTVQTTPNPPVSNGGQGSILNSVSCASAGSCTAVGHYQFANVAPFRTLAEVWNGTAWSLRLPPNNVDAPNMLSSVSCGAVGACTAVGRTQDEGGIPATLIESGD
jgi:hypothetical protein